MDAFKLSNPFWNIKAVAFMNLVVSLLQKLKWVWKNYAFGIRVCCRKIACLHPFEQFSVKLLFRFFVNKKPRFALKRMPGKKKESVVWLNW